MVVIGLGQVLNLRRLTNEIISKQGKQGLFENFYSTWGKLLLEKPLFSLFRERFSSQILFHIHTPRIKKEPNKGENSRYSN